MNNSYLILDLRQNDVFEKGNIQGSSNLPFPKSKRNTYLDKVRITIARKNLKQKEKKSIILVCANGGYVSKYVWDKLRLQNDTYIYKGGYRQYRKKVRQHFNVQYSFYVLFGKTGSGKTKLIRKLEQLKYPVLNLPDLAKHTGSVFGNLSNQTLPSQQQFENNLFEVLNKHNNQTPILTEFEMPNIGSAIIPQKLYAQIKKGIPIYIYPTLKNRIAQLIEDYGDVNDSLLAEGIIKMTSKIGKQKVVTLLEKLKAKNYTGIAKALIDYFDKTEGYTHWPFIRDGFTIRPLNFEELTNDVSEILEQKKTSPKETLLLN